MTNPIRLHRQIISQTGFLSLRSGSHQMFRGSYIVKTLLPELLHQGLWCWEAPLLDVFMKSQRRIKYKLHRAKIFFSFSNTLLTSPVPRTVCDIRWLLQYLLNAWIKEWLADHLDLLKGCAMTSGWCETRRSNLVQIMFSVNQLQSCLGVNPVNKSMHD